MDIIRLDGLSSELSDRADSADSTAVIRPILVHWSTDRDTGTVPVHCMGAAVHGATEAACVGARGREFRKPSAPERGEVDETLSLIHI